MKTAPRPRLITLSKWIFRAMLAAYPEPFRAAYGEEMERTFHDLLRDEKLSTFPEYFAFWLYIFHDMLISAFIERSEELRKMGKRGAMLLVAVALGAAIAWVDSRPHWDDTGITAGAIFLVCALFGAVSPSQPWSWALAVGISVPLVCILGTHNYGAIIALIPAFLGAYLGAGLRWVTFPPVRTT